MSAHKADYRLLSEYIYGHPGTSHEVLEALAHLRPKTVYVVTETKYSDGESSDAFVDLLEGDGDPLEVIRKWQAAMYAWEKANPYPDNVFEPILDASDGAWDEYVKNKRIAVQKGRARAEAREAWMLEHGKDRIEALIKAGFSRVEHCKVEL